MLPVNRKLAGIWKSTDETRKLKKKKKLNQANDCNLISMQVLYTRLYETERKK